MDAFLENIAGNELRLIKCQPHPRRWLNFSNAHQLDWQFTPFRRGGAAALPSAPGFYCFVLVNGWANLPAVFYPLYAGETLDLRTRYRNYLTEKNSRNGRFHVKKFLKVFSGETQFCFAPYNADKDELRQIEKKLNDALMPPYSRRDFTAEVRAGKEAWQ